MILLLNLKMALALALSEAMHTSQKYKQVLSVLRFLENAENVEQLTRNSNLKTNLVHFARPSPKGSNFCLVFGENRVQTETM